jgi:MATE family multidrug resistance protein
MGAMGVAFFIWRERLVDLFTDDPEVIAVGARLMLWAALFQLGDGIQVVLAGALRGAGDTKYVMFVSLAASWAIFVPLTFVMMFVFGRGAEGGWFAVNAWVLALAVALVIRFRGSAWVQARVTEGEVVVEPRPVPDMEVA